MHLFSETIFNRQIKELHFAESLAVTDRATLRFLLLITGSPHPPQQTTQTVISIHEFVF